MFRQRRRLSRGNWHSAQGEEVKSSERATKARASELLTTRQREGDWGNCSSEASPRYSSVCDGRLNGSRHFNIQGKRSEIQASVDSDWPVSLPPLLHFWPRRLAPKVQLHYSRPCPLEGASFDRTEAERSGAESFIC